MTLYVIIAVIGYLLGSIPFGYLLVRIFRGEDVRTIGSGNIGATNVARTGAKGLGAATLALDAVKGLAAVATASWLAPSGSSALTYMSLAALAAVVGHMFPVWLKFKGGKGVATALGVFILLFPKALLVSLFLFIVVVAATRFVSLGSMLGAISFPVVSYFVYRPDWQALAPTCVIALLIVVKHHQNIRRLLAGNENRFGGSKSAAEKPS
ncbi:MAG TPA: glycerol-3-phosphate 1-O-acyltransferase PlsY [Terriglobales bacterium]|nr:glycerol-3-phosphate 1-O-acyltransferase PlsY [Terriglobales bacterium]